jgi:pimeloyl-ACP methyl ester carboxylesterase
VANDVQETLIELCGHYVPEERPAELAGAITNFLAK